MSYVEDPRLMPRSDAAVTGGLLQEVMAAHGGHERFSRFRRARGEFQIEGDIWSSRGGPPALVGGQFELRLSDQSVNLRCSIPRHIESSFTPKVLSIDVSDGGFVETQYNPRSTFAERGVEKPWDDFQLAYICSYSIWNVVSQPFLFAAPGFRVVELPVAEVRNETVRRAQILFPAHIASHAPTILCNVGADGLMQFQEFKFDLMNAPVTSVLRDFADVQGIKFATRRTMYRTSELDRPDPAVFAEIRIGKLTFY
jgi:hypothetical protein